MSARRAAGADAFPRQYARSRRFSLGLPRSITVSADGGRVAFLRSASGTDPRQALWAVDLPGGRERLIADPARLEPTGEERLPAAERARRERQREIGGGIVGYGPDAALRSCAFALGGRLWVADLDAGGARELGVGRQVVDPRLDPTGRRVAWTEGRTLCVAPVGGRRRVLAAEDDPDLSWGSAEFVAAEELQRDRGFWWAPDGRRLVAARVDVQPVQRWYIADPADPTQPPHEVAYPAAGTPNADVTAWVVGLDGRRVKLVWDRDACCYLIDVLWPENAPLALVVQSRDQRVLRVLRADPDTGRTEVADEQRSRYWVELVPGAPRWLSDGRLATVRDDDGARRLWFGDEPVTPPGLHVRQVAQVGADWAIVAASRDQPEVSLWRVDRAGAECLTPGGGVHAGVAGGRTLVVSSATLDRSGTRTVVRPASGRPLRLAAHQLRPAVQPRPELFQAGQHGCWTALLLPDRPGKDRLPVLLDPYGGPGGQRVVARRDAFYVSQWFADQGFAVLVTDNRGTPGRSPAWERAMARDLATPALEDQVDVLLAVAADRPELDLGRVAIRGWSYGGFLAALAVLERPDVFHAAVAGAPVSDMRLYDTAYSERYLGDPTVDPRPYDTRNLLRLAPKLRRPLLLVHGLADDNVVVAHTLRLSAALFAAGRPHRVLPLPGVTHVAAEEHIAANLLRLQLDFLREALRLER